MAKKNTDGWDFFCGAVGLACYGIASMAEDTPSRPRTQIYDPTIYENEVKCKGGDIKIQQVVERISHESEWYTGGYITYDMFSKILNADWDRKLYQKYTYELRWAIMEAMGYEYIGEKNSSKYWRFTREVLKPKEVPVTDKERIEAMIWVIKKAYPGESDENIVFHYLGKTKEERMEEHQRYEEIRKGYRFLRGIVLYSAIFGIPLAFVGFAYLFNYLVNVLLY